MGILQLPRTEVEWKAVAEDYFQTWDFPHCIGALDGKHIQIQKPAGTGSRYYNYKQTFSIVLLGLVNSKHEFLMVDVGINGRISDGGVLHHCEFGKNFYDYKLNLPRPDRLPNSDKIVPYVIVCDDAFMLHPNMMKPYPYTSMKKEERVFNKRLSRARNTIEDTFGILNSRFEILQKPMKLEPEKANKVVLAICYLHNFLCKHQRRTYVTRTGTSHVDAETGTLRPGVCQVTTLEPLFAYKARNFSEVARDIRTRLTEYFNTEDERPWLYQL